MSRSLARFFLCIVILTMSLSAVQHAFAQGITTGYITGTVIDPQGAAISNAAVTATQSATNAQFTGQAQSNGNFELRNLPVGSYVLTITASGFNTLTLQNIGVVVGVETALKTQTLGIGTSQTVTVEAGAPMLSTTQSMISTDITPLEITSLPVSAGLDSLVLISQPGVVGSHDANFGNTNGGPNFSGIAVNGERGRSNNYEIDGQNNNDNLVGGPQFFFNNADALQEQQVITGAYGAQYGRSMGSIVNYVTKAGTNSFHGTGFEFYTGSFLSSLSNAQKSSVFGFCAAGQTPAADGCAVPTVPRSVENQYGGTLGGPVIKDKLWFFGSTFWDPVRQGASPASSGTALTPTPTGLQQLQAAFPGNPAVNALTQTGPFGIKVGNPAPVPISDATGNTVFPVRAVSDGTRTAQIQFGAVQRLEPAIQRLQEHLGRLDWQPTTKDHFFLRYLYLDSLQTGNLSGTSTTSIAQGGFYNVPATDHSVGGDWTHTFSSALVNQLRYSFQQAKIVFTPGALPKCTINSLTNCPASVLFSSGNNSNFGVAANFPQGRITKVSQVQDNATFIRGNHSIAFGGEFQKQNSPNTGLFNYNGVYSFASFNSFLQNGSAPTDRVELADGAPVLPFSEPDVDAYVQDDWKAMKNLTLNIGLRWEWYSNSVNLLHDLTVKRESNPATAFWSSTLPLSQRTFNSIPQDYKKFQPRLGFAYNPNFLNQRLVIRGGYAINADPAFNNIFTNVGGAAPVVNDGLVACNSSCLPASGIQGSSVRARLLPFLPRGGNPGFRNQTTVAPNFHNPYGQTYTLGVQYQIASGLVGEARYLGNHTIGNFQTLDSNPYLLPVATDFPGVVSPSTLCQDKTQPGYGRPNCNLSNVVSRNNTAFSVYNSLQTQLSTSSFHGLTAKINYTYSRAVDNASEISSTGAGGSTSSLSQNPLDTNVAERGVSGFSYTNAASIGAVYQVPLFEHRHDLMGRLFGGFAVNAIYQYNTGQPFSLLQGTTSSAGDTAYDIPGKGVGTARPVLSSRSAPLNTVGIYIDDPTGQVATNGTGYYAYNGIDPTSGLYNQPISASSVHWLWNNEALAKLVGNPFPGAGRNILRGQAFNNLDASVFKTVTLTERTSLQLQMNGFNVLNHEFYGTPDVSVEDYAPGSSSSSFLSQTFNAGTNRTFQLGGKIIF